MELTDPSEAHYVSKHTISLLFLYLMSRLASHSYSVYYITCRYFNSDGSVDIHHIDQNDDVFQWYTNSILILKLWRLYLAMGRSISHG
jgi:hypothetical protein